MLRALSSTGWHNYSLFLREDGLLIGYFETPDLQAALAGMDATDVNARWQAEMAEFFVDLGEARPDTGFTQLAEIFHLEDQLDPEGPGPMTSFTDISRPARRARDRGPLLGLRQLRHPVQGVRLGRARRAAWRRRSPTPRRCTGSPGWPRASRCTSRGTSSTTTASSRRTPRTWASGSGTINSNTFQDDDYKLGSLTHADPKVRAKAVQHNLDCIEVMNQTGSRDLKIWLADGTNYPGQGDIRARQDWLAEGLAEIYSQIGEDQRLVLEYKFFEPAFYHTDVPDWGTSYAQVSALGERAVVCLDTGHHAPGTNIEFIVAQLLRLGKLGSFDFNSRFYADDDLIVGAADPFQLFRIMVEVIRGGGYGAGSRRRADARPVPQHRGEGPRPDPLGAQRAGDDGARAAARHRRPRRRLVRPATCCSPTRSSWTRSTPTYDVTWPPGARSAGCRPTRCGPISRAGTRNRSRPTAWAGPRQDGTDVTDINPTVAALSSGRTGSVRTRRTPTTPAATPPPRASRPTPSPTRTSSCCG